jgi:hypothetical protein
VSQTPTGYPLCPNLWKAATLATPFNNWIAESIDEYQAFLKTLGYSPITEAVYGMKVRYAGLLFGDSDACS